MFRRSSFRSVFGLTVAAASFTPLAATGQQLPTGVTIEPAGSSIAVGQLPLALALAPNPRYAVLLLSGWREQGLQVVDRTSGRVVQTVPQAAAFLGLAFAPDGKTLYASGANQDVIYRYAWANHHVSLVDSLVLAVKPAERAGSHYPAGLALSPDGGTLYVAENLADSLAVVDVTTGKVTARFATERYPYGVVVAPNGMVYVSAWGGHTVSVFRPAAGGSLLDAGRIRVGRHPSALLLNRDGARLFVASGSTDRIAVVDTRTRGVLTGLADDAPAGPHEGSTPDALALSADGRRLYVAEADNNAVAVFDLAPQTGGYVPGEGDALVDKLVGRMPVAWYPTALALSADTLLVVNGKGRGTAPNPTNPQPTMPRPRGEPAYTLGQLSATLTTLPLATVSPAELTRLSGVVARVNRWTERSAALPAYPPIEHVIYVIKENRTYDQVFGDMPQGDGDTSLVLFGRSVTPNHHALAERFGLFDRFFVNAEVSGDGHNWSTAAYATDYVEKTVSSNYSGRRWPYDYEGTNRNRVPSDDGDDDVNAPANGYLWDAARRGGIWLRNYGEFVVPVGVTSREEMPSGYRGNKPFLAANTDPAYAGFNVRIPDQKRADEWIKELHEFVRRGSMPQLEIVRLPNDHTSYGSPGLPTPRAFVADNDVALGRMVEALSNSPFWKSTVMFVLEDDAQAGPDHVDSHRSVALAISPYTKGGVLHRWTNTTDVIATITEILRLGSLSQFDYYGRPLRDIWTSAPDLRPYATLKPEQPLDQLNPAGGRDADASRGLDLRFEDRVEDELGDRLLWRMIKGTAPYPGATRMPALQWKRSP
jgi:YVTN family beta-propeller protein